jgi:hypothetical protein
MNAIRNLLATLAVIVATSSPALAAGTRSDHSGLVVWMFLGFCGLIVVAQLVPAILMLIGMAKGVAADPLPAEVHND